MRATRSRPLVLLFAALVAATVAGCGRRELGSGRGVLILAIDGLRMDHAGIGGYDRPTTPNLDALATQGVSFTQAFSASPANIPAHVALLTGCDPLVARLPPFPAGESRVLDRAWWLPPELPSLAREFLSAGYTTAGFVDHPWLTDRLGLGNGFERWFGFGEGVDPGHAPRGFEAGARRFLRWVRALDQDRDWFAYVTVDDLTSDWAGRDPEWGNFFQPRPGLERVPPIAAVDQAFFAIPLDEWPGGTHSIGEYEAHYDGRLRRLDDQIGRLLGQLSATGRLRETTVCVVGTFGVGFGESGLVLDHGTLTDVDLHVPWILRPPSSFQNKRAVVSDRLASTMDVAPTLLELAGVEVPRGVHGVSQLDALRGEAMPAREYAFARGGVHDGFAVRDERYSFELVAPGAGGAATLQRSWFGDRRLRYDLVREHLRDRRSAAGPGDLEASAEAPEEAARLRAAGEEWYLWMERARDAIQRAPWRSEPLAPELLEELWERGALPEGLRPAG